MDNILLKVKTGLLQAVRSWMFIVLSLIFILLSSILLSNGNSGNGIKEATIALLVYGWFFLILLKLQDSQKNFIWNLLLLVFWLKVLVVFLNYSIPIFLPTQDALQNDIVASELASTWSKGNFSLSFFSQPIEPAYVIPMALTYFLFGYNLYLGCLLNILAATASVYFVFRIAELLFGKKEAILASILYAFMPYLNFMSFFFNREIIVVFIMIVLAYMGLQWLQKEELKHPFVLGLLLIALFLLRPENTLIMLTYFIFIYLGGLRKQPRRLALAIKILSASITAILILIFAANYLITNPEILRYIHLRGVRPENLYARAARHIQFGLAYLPPVAPDSWLETFATYAPLQSFNFLVRPFLWEIFRPKQTLFVLNNLILYIFYIFAFVGLLRLSLKPSPLYLFSVCFFLFISVFLSSLVQGNAFAAVRHREQFIFFVYILSSGGLVILQQSVRNSLTVHHLNALRTNNTTQPSV